MIYADDIALFTTDPVSLQIQLDCVNNFSKKWGLKLTQRKQKSVFFIGFNVNLNTDYLPLKILKHEKKFGQTFLFLNVYLLTKFHGNTVIKWQDMRHGY